MKTKEIPGLPPGLGKNKQSTIGVYFINQLYIMYCLTVPSATANSILVLTDKSSLPYSGKLAFNQEMFLTSLNFFASVAFYQSSDYKS